MDAHIYSICKQLVFKIPLPKGLSNIFPREILYKIYKTYVQHKFHYGITLWACTTNENVITIQSLPGQVSRIITENCWWSVYHLEKRLLISKSIHNNTVGKIWSRYTMNRLWYEETLELFRYVNKYIPSLILHNTTSDWQLFHFVVRDKGNRLQASHGQGLPNNLAPTVGLGIHRVLGL